MDASPLKHFAIGSPPAFILFGPKDYVDFVLQSPNPTNILYPWGRFDLSIRNFLFHLSRYQSNLVANCRMVVRMDQKTTGLLKAI